MEVILLFVRLILAAIFALAAVGKFLDLEGSEKAVKSFDVPENLAKPFSILLPAAELLFALLLLFTTTSWLGAIGAFLLLAVFIGGMIRNIIFGVLALLLVAQGRENQGLSFFDLQNEMAIQLFIGLATVALLGAVVYFLKKISEQQTQIMRRIEILELTGVDGTKTVEREEASAPAPGLTIGSFAPDFELPDLNGKATTLKDLIQPNKATALFFVSPSCSPCGALLPDIEKWQEQFKDSLNLVFISSGEAKANAEKFAGNTFKKVLLQQDREVAEMFGAKWTPTVVLINSDGRVASHAKAGDAAIKELFASVENAGAENGKYLIAGENGSSKIGTQLPEFELKNIEGNLLTTKDLIGKPTLLTYWSMGCGFCVRMIEDLRDWDKTKGQDEPNLLVVSSGDAEKHKEMEIASPIVLDDERKLPNELGMNGTPSAILIDEKGRIISEVAVGATNIWSLLGKKK